MTGTNLLTLLNNNTFAVVLSAELHNLIDFYDVDLRNKMATDALVKTLDSTGLRYMPVTGVYKCQEEQSFIVFCSNICDVLRVECIGLDQHSQECVMVLDLEHGCAVLKYREQALIIGTELQPVERDEAITHDAYTMVDGEYWVVV